MNLFYIYSYIIILNLIYVLILKHTSASFIFMTILCFFLTVMLFMIRAIIFGRKLSRIIKKNHPWIYEKYKARDRLARLTGPSEIIPELHSLVHDENVMSEVYKEEKKLLKKYINNRHAIKISFIIIVMSSIYLFGR